MRDLKVDPTELRLHSHRLEDAANELRDGHKRVHSDVAELAQGFSGGPAFAAINALLEDWESETDAGHKNLQAESHRHMIGAATYENQDNESAQGFKSADPQ